jgi:hypothetical protein
LIWEGRTMGRRSKIYPQEYAELPWFLREKAIFDLRE